MSLVYTSCSAVGPEIELFDMEFVVKEQAYNSESNEMPRGTLFLVFEIEKVVPLFSLLLLRIPNLISPGPGIPQKLLRRLFIAGFYCNCTLEIHFRNVTLDLIFTFWNISFWRSEICLFT